jgi:hypothetical protein
MSEEQDYVIVWEAPKLIPPEFRLYYDDKGAVVCYTGDTTTEGNYIVIDAMTFAEARSDLRIIDGKISRAQPNAVVYKLMPNNSTGIACHPEDISILVDDTSEHIKWKLNIYELQ